VLPSIQEIEEMERQRLQAVEALEISDDNGSGGGSGTVKCQSCSMVVPLLKRSMSSRPRSIRIGVLQRQIKWLEQHYKYICRLNHHVLATALAAAGGNGGKGNGNGDGDNDGDVLKQIKQELAELLEEDAKADKLRNIPLYSCKITGYKFVCSKCYDKAYTMLQKH
jgi:hypothetical protein